MHEINFQINAESELTIENLTQCFPTLLKRYEPYFAQNPIGLEVEVKWRDYFPGLWNKYLADTPYKMLAPELQKALSEECTELEKSLLPALELTQSCGVPKGADKYWEFAFAPVTNIELVCTQIDILQFHNLIPPGQHSLHMTLGNMRESKDSYYLLLLLELMTCDTKRIMTAFHKENHKLSASWARKGLGGLFVKEERELQHGAKEAIELRTLELTGHYNLYPFLKITSILSDIIINKQKKIPDMRVHAWNEFRHVAESLLKEKGLADENWKKPNLSPHYWQHYVEQFETLKEQLLPLFWQSNIVNQIEENLFKSTNYRKKFL